MPCWNSKWGGTATAAAFDSGYESLSGFGYTYKKLLGSSPQHSLNHSPILINRLTTPLGPMFVCAIDKGIYLLEFVDRKMLETEFSDLQRLLKSKIIMGENEHIAQAKSEMAEYFTGNRKNFTVSLDHPGSDFQKTVWTGLKGIGFAETTTYSGLAEKVGKPAAVRAVGRANGANRISIMVPCHRIIGKDGQLTGYGGGLERKRWLLNHEQQFASN